MFTLRGWVDKVAADSGIDAKKIKIQNQAVKRKRKEQQKTEGLQRRGGVYKTKELN